VTRYRLLYTTRAYALEKLEHGGQLPEVERRYTRYINRARKVSGR
jgi:predicted ATPase